MIREVATPRPVVKAEKQGILPPRQAARCYPAFGKRPRRAGLGIPRSYLTSRSTGPAGSSLTRQAQIEAWHRERVTQLSNEAHPPFDGPQGDQPSRCASLTSCLGTTTTTPRRLRGARRSVLPRMQHSGIPPPAFSFLRSSYFPTRRHPGGPEVGCGRELRASA